MPSIIQDEVQQCGGKLFIFSNLRSIISDNITSLVEIIREVVINLLVKFDRRVYLLVLDLTLFKSARLFFTDIVDELDNRPDSGDACGAVEDLHRSYWSAFLAMKLRSVSRSPFLFERSVASSLKFFQTRPCQLLLLDFTVFGEHRQVLESILLKEKKVLASL